MSERPQYATGTPSAASSRARYGRQALGSPAEEPSRLPGAVGLVASAAWARLSVAASGSGSARDSGFSGIVDWSGSTTRSTRTRGQGPAAGARLRGGGRRRRVCHGPWLPASLPEPVRSWCRRCGLLQALEIRLRGLLERPHRRTRAPRPGATHPRGRSSRSSRSSGGDTRASPRVFHRHQKSKADERRPGRFRNQNGRHDRDPRS